MAETPGADAGGRRRLWRLHRRLQRRLPRRLRRTAFVSATVEHVSGAASVFCLFALAVAGLRRDTAGVLTWAAAMAGLIVLGQVAARLSQRTHLRVQEQFGALVDAEIVAALGAHGSLAMVLDARTGGLLAQLAAGRNAIAALPVVSYLAFGLLARIALTGVLLALVTPYLLALVAAAGVAAWLSLRVRQAATDAERRLATETADLRRLLEVAMDPVAVAELRGADAAPAVSAAIADFGRRRALEVRRTSRRVLALQAAAGAVFAATFGLALLYVGHGGFGAVALLLPALLGRQLSRQLAALGVALAPVTKGVAQLRHFADLLDLAEDAPPAEGAELRGHAWALDVHDVDVAYGDTLALREVSLSVRPGRIVAIVGPNGAGKSTLLLALLGLLPLRAGQILLDGRPCDVAGGPRTATGVAFQTPWPFELTVEDAVLLGRDHLREGVRPALERGGALAFVDALPERERTPLGATLGGPSLSGGQQQRLANSRCFLPARRLLVLDEPGGALDWDGERHLIEQLRLAAKPPGVAEPAAVVFVTHRLDIARAADEIVVVRDARIAERGTHDELMALRGVYRSMFEAQATTYGVGSPTNATGG